MNNKNQKAATGCACGGGCGYGRRAPRRKETDLERQLRMRREAHEAGPPQPFRTNRYPASKDPYVEHLRYGLAKGLISASMLTQIGLDAMRFLPERPRFVSTAQGLVIAGTRTDAAPTSPKPYACKSDVIASIAYGLKYGVLTYDTVAAMGLDPYAIRTCLP
jgi:hypothetical protein